MKKDLKTILRLFGAENCLVSKVPEELLKALPLFIDMVLIENIVDAFECCARADKALEFEDIEDAAKCLICCIPYAGIGSDQEEI